LAETGLPCTLPEVHVETLGSGPRLVLVHGSGRTGWPLQRPLGERYTLMMPTRSGYPPNPPQDWIDFEVQADELAALLEPGDHLVGHSYGGVVALFAATHVPLQSLTVLEPPAFGVALDVPLVKRLVDDLEPLWPTELPPEEFLRRFVETIGAELKAPSPLPPEVEASVRALMVERAPWEAVIPFADLAAAPFPKLVVSGAHSEAFDAVCDALESGLGAERAVVEGGGHSIPRAPAFNDVLVDFLERSTH
jgi:pimeloyl-ACP methyl ester carboxylesterase